MRILNLFKMRYLIIVVIIVLFSGCSERIHVITEQDGDRVINWYSDK